MKLSDGIFNGAIAGAAGTTALNAVTYLDMAVRGRPSSSGPEDTVERLAEKSSVRIPGDQETRSHRVTGLGALTGIASGLTIGAAVGTLRAAGWLPGLVATSVIATLGAMAFTDGVMSALGLTDPRTWSATDWASDVAPHLAYGLLTAVALER